MTHTSSGNPAEMNQSDDCSVSDFVCHMLSGGTKSEDETITSMHNRLLCQMRFKMYIEIYIENHPMCQGVGAEGTQMQSVEEGETLFSPQNTK